MSKHTPGPWKARDLDSDRETPTIWEGGNQIAEVECGIHKENLANARLIAAAPETAAERDSLREINKELVKMLDWFMDKLDDKTLVRDISRDHESGFHMRMMVFTERLSHAATLVGNAKAERGES